MILKDGLFSDKKFFLGASLKLGIFQILFCLMGFVLAGAGHGTYVQFPIFYSWLFIPAIVDWPKEWINDNIQIAFLFFVPVAFFIFSLMVFIALWFDRISKNGLKMVVTFHFLIAFLIIVKFSIRYGFSFPDVKIQFFATAIALLLSFFYWRIFFQILSHKSIVMGK